MAIGVGQRCVVRIKITGVELRNAKDIVATVESPQYVAHCQEVSFDEVSGLVYVAVDVNSAGSYSMWLEVRFAEEVVYTPAFVFAEVEGDAKPCDAPYIVDVEVAGESVTVTPPKVDVDAVTREEFERLSKDVAGKVDKVEGKGLSTNNYTDADKALVQTIPNKVSQDEFNETVAGLGEAINDVGTVLSKTKANKEGYYPDMSVGMADNLVGRGDVQDAQINFRPSAGADNITDGAARIERIKGNSVVWNQLVNTDSISVELVAKRTYFTDINGEQSVRIISATTTIEAQSGRDKVVDLTQMFGAGNEPTSYEEYLQRKPMNIEDEYAHNEGELIDMKVDSLISTNDNAYDYTKGYARVMGGYNYTITLNNRQDVQPEEVLFSTDLEEFAGNSSLVAPNADGTYTFPMDGYVKVYFAEEEEFIEEDKCVCLQHSYDKPHPAHQQDVKDLSFISEAFPEGMRSAGGVCDEIRFNPTKKVWEKVTRIGAIDLGSLSWQFGASINSDIKTIRSVAPLDNVKKPTKSSIISNILSDIYSVITADKVYSVQQNGVSLNINGQIYLFDSDYTDTQVFKQAMQERGAKLYYELAKPIVEDIDLSPNFNLDYFAWDFGTEEAL